MLSKFKHNSKILKKIDHFKNSLFKIKLNKLNSLIKKINFYKKNNQSKIKLNKFNDLFKRKNLKYLINYYRASFLLVGLIVAILSYLSIPYFYDSNKLINKVENELSKNLNINFNLTEDLSYSFFPRPSFSFQKVSFLNQVENVGNIKINISFRKLLFAEKIEIEDIILYQVNFNINKKNYGFFTNLLKNNFSNFKFQIKNSNIFYRNIKNEVLFINKIDKLEYYYDTKKLSNFLLADNEIFNIPYKIKFKNDFDKKNNISIINFDLLKLKIENKLSYKSFEKEGSVKFLYNKKNSKGEYKFDKNFFKFIYCD
jgi:disulfide oxidoreductase YuzD